MELHPDRNLDDIENKTRLFAEVQSAFEVLSNSQDRAWYDAHRDSILGVDEEVVEGSSASQNVMTTKEIVGFLDNHGYRLDKVYLTKLYEMIRDFYDSLGEVERLAAESRGQEAPNQPLFESETREPSDVPINFYSYWSNFYTFQNFAWVCLFRTQGAQDRRTRRLMEKENQRLRDQKIREFNGAVRSLTVAIRKKLGPGHASDLVTGAERNEQLHNASLAQAAKSRSENLKNVSHSEIPDWAKIEDCDESEASYSRAEEKVIQLCQPCRKTFKTSNQLVSHERSKKHLKMIKNLGEQATGRCNKVGEAPSPNAMIGSKESLAGGHVDNEGESEASQLSTLLSQSMVQELEANGNANSKEYANQRTSERNSVFENIQDLQSSSLAGADFSLGPKAKDSRRHRRAQKVDPPEQTEKFHLNHQCGFCQVRFTSRTKLFNHVRETSHSVAVGEGQRSSRNRRGRVKPKLLAAVVHLPL